MQDGPRSLQACLEDPGQASQLDRVESNPCERLCHPASAAQALEILVCSLWGSCRGSRFDRKLLQC